MRFTKTFAIAALSMAAALPAMAQSTSSSTSTTSTQSSPAAQSPSATDSGAPASTTTTTTTTSTTLSVGLPVKDKTGVVIGEIADLKPGAGGQTATVKMGEQSFAIGAQSFVVQDGAAVINATQAELKAMIANAAKAG